MSTLVQRCQVLESKITNLAQAKSLADDLKHIQQRTGEWQACPSRRVGLRTRTAPWTLVSQDAATAWNFGPSSHELRTVGEVIATFYRQWGDGAPSVEFTEAEHAENPRLTLNASRAAERFRWRPLLDTTEAVEWAARWYRAAFDGESPQRLVERDVDRYFELVAREDSLCLSP